MMISQSCTARLSTSHAPGPARRGGARTDSAMSARRLMPSTSSPVGRWSGRARPLACRVGTLLAALFAIGAEPPCASAQQGTGGGTIYHYDAAIKTMWTMESNGSNNSELGFGTFGPVSTEPHNNHRWFIDTRPIPNSYYPDGTQRAEVFAFREDYDFTLNNNSSTRVQLTNDIALQPSNLYALDWVPGDQMISVKARRWSGNVVNEGGLYVVPLLFDVDGNLVGSGAPMSPAVAFPLDGSLWPSFRSYGWDPTGSKVVYEWTTGLWVCDLLQGTHTRIHGSGTHPQWSPDGSKIAFTNGNGGISTIKPGGTGLKEIVRRTSEWAFGGPYWSTGSTHIVCVGSDRNGNSDLFRVTASGKFLTILTPNTPSVRNYPGGWR